MGVGGRWILIPDSPEFSMEDREEWGGGHGAALSQVGQLLGHRTPLSVCLKFMPIGGGGGGGMQKEGARAVQAPTFLN